MNLLQLVKNRHSTREYTNEPINNEIIEKIINIASYAPSSWGGYPLEYIVVKDKDTLNELARCKAMGAKPIENCTAAIIPIIDARNLELWREDVAVASTYILLACEYYRIGACWIHYDHRNGHTLTASEDVKTLLNVPEYYEVLNIISLGHFKYRKDNQTLSSKIHKEVY